MSRDRSLATFIGHLRDQVLFVASMSGVDSITLGEPEPSLRAATHKKVLYAAILDFLARVRYKEDNLRNRDRFMKVIEEHANWGDRHLVAVPILNERLNRRRTESEGNPQQKAEPRASGNTALASEVSRRLAAVDPQLGNAQPLSLFDSSTEELEALSSSEEEREQIKRARHLELFYTYRNFLVHEFEPPGYGFESLANGKSEPLYHSVCSSGDHYKWRLLYPEGFFRCIVENAVDSLEGYFKVEAIDPYSLLGDSSDWQF